MSQDQDLSSLTPVVPDPGKHQWVKGKSTGTDDKQKERTHTVGVLDLMPGVIIFVHGVNSDGEWYFDASEEFAKGLNQRLGRDDLERLVPDKEGNKDKVTANRYLKTDESGKRIRSPVIPFWWGYQTQPTERKIVKGTDQLGSTPARTDFYGNPLRTDGAWGGGPFQNGGSALTSFWLPTGFRKDVLFGMIDVNTINPVVGRMLCDCPPRLYYAHAARRLANLVKDIRKNLPNEPINIVSHSQGTIVAMCALFFLGDDVRGPDTLILNSSPYRFDTAKTDFISAADGRRSVQPEPARVATFVNAARIMAGATKGYPAPPEPKFACTVEHKPRHAYDDAVYCHKPADAPQWQAEIGGKVEDPDGPRGQDGKPWWSNAKFERSDTRGKLFVNFNPGDRVIGVSAVSGMGWRGIPTRYMEKVNQEKNVQQRLFARGTNGEHNPPVGTKPNGIALPYFYKQIVPVTADSNGEPAGELRDLRYLDGSEPNAMWKLDPEKIFGLVPVQGDLKPKKDGEVESVIVNAPEVPRPLNLPQKFDGSYVRYDGQEGTTPDGTPVQPNSEQQEDFKDDVRYQERQTVMRRDEKGLPTHVTYESWEEVEKRRRNKVGKVLVSPTNHAAILRFFNDDDGSSPVADVLSYDVTVGLGYAWHDEAYWNYLLDLADWKKSDPYYATGKLPDADKTMPPGIVAGNAPASAARSTSNPTGAL
ncbi:MULTISPECIES: T6SS effector phospholipase Tle3 domain-containing protein [unclassified Variovorax]|uniref:T6SS effector phospholipase Tle3 domain-containing protein n=1 Tax=unclassified Variovorax TaxID=663243 RepID=UPI003F450EAD